MKPIKVNILRIDVKPIVAELKVIADALALICKRSYGISLREVDLTDASPKDEPTVSYHDEQEALVEELQEQHINTEEGFEAYLRGNTENVDFPLPKPEPKS